MSHQQDRAAHGEATHGLDHIGLGDGVQAGRGLVEQEHRGVPEEGASQGDPLALAGGEARPPLSERRVEPLRQPGDDVRQAGVDHRRARSRRPTRSGGRGGCCRRSTPRRGVDAGAPTPAGPAKRPAPARRDRHRRSSPCRRTPGRSPAARRAASTSRSRSGPSTPRSHPARRPARPRRGRAGHAPGR